MKTNETTMGNNAILRAFGYDPTTDPNRENGREYAAKLSKFTEVKQKHPEAVVILYSSQVCEALQDDADILARGCGLVVAQFGGGVRVVGFPSYNLDAYIAKITQSGHAVAVVAA